MKRITYLAVILFIASVCDSYAKTDKYRLVWDSDPTRSITIGWDQVSGDTPRLYYDANGHQPGVEAYANSAKPTHTNTFLDMENTFVHLTGLKPDTPYYFVVADSEGTGRKLWFKTAPSTNQPFTCIAGGDSRSQPKPRQDGNKLVAKLRPLFILFGGDYTSSNRVKQWKSWLNDWQLTISDDGRIYPIIPTHGNHENNRRDALEKLFNTKNVDSYASLGFGENLLRVWGLNSELVKFEDKWNRQTEWFTQDLKNHKDVTWKVSIYHKPMRPHLSRKKENDPLVNAWAGLFQTYHMDLAIESDSHLVKRTYPIIPSKGPGSSEAFIRDDKKGTVYVGEGSWGAPLRKANDNKPWTMASDSFFQFKWIHVSPNELLIRSVKFENVDAVEALTEASLMTIPKNLRIWEPPTGSVLRIPFDAEHSSYTKPAMWKDIIVPGSSWSYTYPKTAPATDWATSRFDASAWQSGHAPLGYGEGKEATVLDFGKDEDAKPMTAYFRQTVTLPDDFTAGSYTCSVVCDDGCVIYINGNEAGRYNMPAGGITNKTPAEDTRVVNETKFRSVTLSESLKPGKNTIAVEVHQIKPSSSDLRFDMQLRAK